MDMSPEYIFYDYDPQTSQMKFQFVLLDLIFRNLFFEIKLDKIHQSRCAYIHVELFEHLVKGTTHLNVNFFKENTYSLGLIVLSLAINCNFQSLYSLVSTPYHGDLY